MWEGIPDGATIFSFAPSGLFLSTFYPRGSLRSLLAIFLSAPSGEMWFKRHFGTASHVSVARPEAVGLDRNSFVAAACTILREMIP